MINKQESITAKLCSFARAYHSNYGRDKIFDDYLAYDMMGKQEYEEIGQLIENDFKLKVYDPNAVFKTVRINSKLNKYISPIPLSRIAYAEEKLTQFADRHGECQYVICGAGMDTFAFRNDNENITVFELDHPDTQRYKLEKIRRLEWNIPHNAKYVPIDFSVDNMEKVLKSSGFRTSVPTFFSILGVTYYLTLPVFAETISHIAHLSDEYTELVFDYPDETTFQQNKKSRVSELSDITAQLGEPMKHGYGFSELEKTLENHGFSVTSHMTPQKIQKSYFKNRQDGQYAFENIHFILAAKGESI